MSYSDVESALNAEGWLGGHLINRSTIPGWTELAISVHVPTSAITAAGDPQLDAVKTLRSVAEALAALDRQDPLGTAPALPAASPGGCPAGGRVAARS